MAGDLVLAPEAEVDVTDAYIWYEGRRIGLGEEFLSAVDAALESIRRRPEMYPLSTMFIAARSSAGSLMRSSTKKSKRG
jgi:hypothetical protein